MQIMGGNKSQVASNSRSIITRSSLTVGYEAESLDPRRNRIMSGLENSTFRYIRAALVATLMLPGTLLAVTAARQSRMMVVHVRDSSNGILETFQSAAVAAGLRCRRLGPPRLDGWRNPGVQCLPNSDRNLGLVDVLDVTESKSVVVSAFSSNVSTPRGELDPAVEAALVAFRHALDGNPQILRIDECAAPNYDGCSSN
jgi:hypothetical protein